MKQKKIIINATTITIILLYVLLKANIYIYDYNQNINKENLTINIEQPKEITDYNQIIEDLKVQYNNEDVRGILEISNTDYKVPIMQGKDNEYYLKHTPYNKKSRLGSIYLDYRVDIDSSKKLLIYGHNSSKIEMPFKILENYYDEKYYQEHKYIEITSSKEKKKYEIFSVYVETEDFDYMNINFKTTNEYLKHINKLKNKSMYDTGIELKSTDEILILQTCSEHKDYKKYKKKYLLIILKKV